MERFLKQDWLHSPALVKVLAALAAEGGEARMVGGCVRDSLAGRKVRDIDIATPLPPDDVVRLLEKAGLKAIPTGLAHGTVTAIAEGRPFEITTLRRDVETTGRHATVAYTGSWEEDAARRDFTMNAMYLSASGELFDYFGGQEDLRAGRVRFIGDPCTRITEDYLRILRFFRFTAYFGKIPPEAEALAACGALAPQIVTLSGERIQAEMFKLLAAPDPTPALTWMKECGVWPHILPAHSTPQALAAHIAAEQEAGATPSPLRRLAALLRQTPQAAEALAERWRLSNADRETLLRLVTQPLPAPALETRQQKAQIRKLGGRVFADLVLLAWGETPDARYKAMLDAAQSWQPPIFPVTGKDLLALGYAPGPALGEALRKLEDAWEAGEYHPSRENLLALLKNN